MESVYAEALAIEFRVRGIPFEREKPLFISYKGNVLPCTFRVDMMCYGDIVVELKAQAATGNPEAAQVANYLRATGNELGLLLNFGTQILEKKRVIYKADWARSRTPEDDMVSENAESSEDPRNSVSQL